MCCAFTLRYFHINGYCGGLMINGVHSIFAYSWLEIENRIECPSLGDKWWYRDTYRSDKSGFIRKILYERESKRTYEKGSSKWKKRKKKYQTVILMLSFRSKIYRMKKSFLWYMKRFRKQGKGLIGVYDRQRNVKWKVLDNKKGKRILTMENI